jgi:hypothetical protein
MAREETIQLEGRKNRKMQLLVACMAASAALTAAYVANHLRRQQALTSAQDLRKYTGRVVSSLNQAPIADAQVSFEGGGIPPKIKSSDSEGIFLFYLPKDWNSGVVRIEARGFQRYTREVNLTAAPEMEIIGLKPEEQPGTVSKREPSHRNTSFRAASFTPDPVVHPDAPMRQPQTNSFASMLNGSLPSVSGEGGPWAVIVFGDHHERHDDMVSWVRSALGGSGHDTVSLFRSVSDEQRMAGELFRGSSDVLSRLQAGRYCSRILVGKLSVVSLGATEGLYIARATLAVHLLSPTGQILKPFELSEKGGGMDAESAQSKAIDELSDVIQRDLPAKID